MDEGVKGTVDDAKQIVEEAKRQAAEEKPVAQAGPMAEVPVPLREMAGALARYLVKGRPDFARCMAAMIFTRQLYGVAVKDLEYRVAEINANARKAAVENAIKQELDGKELPDVDPAQAWELVEEVIMAAASNEAAKPFNETVLFANLEAAVKPWLHDVVKEHVGWERKAQQEAWDAYEKARRERAIPLGVKIRTPIGARDDQEQDTGDTLLRNNSLVLFGWKPAVMYLLDQIVTTVLALKDQQLYTVIRLQRQTGKIEPQPRLSRLGGKVWEDCCRSGTSWPKLFQEKVLLQLSDPPDLLVVDDLPWAGQSAGLTVGSLARKAGAAHRRFRQWADKVGCGVIAAIPGDEKIPPAPFGSDWEQLKNYSTLRPVTVEEVGEKYKITVGKDLATLWVERSALDGSTGSKLILPQ